ncbi:hypothetical protein SMU21_03076 [Streptococcus mutans 1SM1]|nr:hypothetical protein SMU21_03076 [Streptococcus mutans 1SM1]
MVVFDHKSWIESNNKEYINTFLNEVFKGVSNQENENTRYNEDLGRVIKSLNEYGFDINSC